MCFFLGKQEEIRSFYELFSEINNRNNAMPSSEETENAKRRSSDCQSDRPGKTGKRTVQAHTLRFNDFRDDLIEFGAMLI